MRVLITGGAGFIGSHLVDRYLAKGHTVLAVDNLITGDFKNVRDARGREGFYFLDADVTGSWKSISDFVEARLGGVDLILHFASPASPIDYAAHPLETLAVNSVGTERCCRAALAWRARLLYASTSECYGDPKEHPQREDYWGNVNPIGPRSCYDEGKRFGEALVSAFVRTHDLDARIVRIFNTFGPRMRRNDGRVVPNFITQALSGQALTVFGGGQTRSFCFVEDLVDGIERCAAAENARGVAVNLGNPDEHSIREFARIVCALVGVPLRIESLPIPEDDPGRRRPDITRAQLLLGWQPRICLEEGLRRTIASFREAVAQ